MEKDFREVNQSIKESGSPIRGSSILLRYKYNHSFIGDGVENILPSIDVNLEKQIFSLNFRSSNLMAHPLIAKFFLQNISFPFLGLAEGSTN